ncbi:hypothetical protein CCACVL1_03033 [Corchorus capsularis]|uniref:Uncharacterized protein n=1 Tax=Corchorus capsularis TaxID=210143 RepID=A0A1R3K3N0_COCAP|nr:hypothetical protein CCACVL1_03033 [Corchorus capsularis]
MGKAAKIRPKGVVDLGTVSSKDSVQ